MKFLVEESLGRLVKELRILGYDTVIVKSINIDAIITLANRQNRIYLTRSGKQAKLKQQFLRRLIKSVNHIEQLQEIQDLVGYHEENLFSRCLKCNARLEKVKEPQGILPESVLKNQAEFSYCKHCRKDFWKGTHHRDMEKRMQNIFRK